jgi:hypothetical protein
MRPRGGCGDDRGEHTTLPWRERRMRYLAGGVSGGGGEF